MLCKITNVACKRAGDSALPSFLASMRSVSVLVETFLSKTKIAGADELEEVLESWSAHISADVSVGTSLPDDQKRQKP